MGVGVEGLWSMKIQGSYTCRTAESLAERICIYESVEDGPSSSGRMCSHNAQSNHDQHAFPSLALLLQRNPIIFSVAQRKIHIFYGDTKHVSGILRQRGIKWIVRTYANTESPLP